LSQSALLDVLDAIKEADVADRVRESAATIHQALIEAEVDDPVKGPRCDTGISKSEVSRICADLDEGVAAFRGRSLGPTRTRTCSSTRPTAGPG
jgi:hypothetical protein